MSGPARPAGSPAPRAPELRTQLRELVAWGRKNPIGGLFLVALVAIAAVTALRPPPPPTPNRLGSGDCLSLRGQTATAAIVAAVRAGEMDRAACGNPHGAEVAQAQSLGAPSPSAQGLPPSQDRLDATTKAWCRDAFSNYVGTAPEGSIFQAIPVAPLLADFTQDQGVAVCLVVRKDGAPITGLARGSGK